MIRKILVICVFFVVGPGCMNIKMHDKVSPTTSEISDAVKCVTIFSEKFRNNTENEGGDETMIYLPSTYFNPDPKYVADQRPIWMKHQEIAYIFLIGVIASDHGFDGRSWSAFFQGFDKLQRPQIIEMAKAVNKLSYEKICETYGYGDSLAFIDFRKKFESLLMRQ